MGYVYNNDLKQVYRIDSDGFVYDAARKRIGRVREDGYIYDNLFNLVGHIDGDGNIFDSGNRWVCRVRKDGSIYSGKLEKIAQADQEIVNRVYHKPDPPTSSSGILSPIILLFAFIAIGVTALAGPKIVLMFLTPPAGLITLAVFAVTCLLGAFLNNENKFGKEWLISYVLLLIAWFYIIIKADWGGLSGGSGLDGIVAAIVAIPVGFVAMAAVALMTATVGIGFRVVLKAAYSRGILPQTILGISVAVGVLYFVLIPKQLVHQMETELLNRDSKSASETYEYLQEFYSFRDYSYLEEKLSELEADLEEERNIMIEEKRKQEEENRKIGNYAGTSETVQNAEELGYIEMSPLIHRLLDNPDLKGIQICDEFFENCNRAEYVEKQYEEFE